MLVEVLWFPLFYDELGERLWELVVNGSKFIPTLDEMI